LCATGTQRTLYGREAKLYTPLGVETHVSLSVTRRQPSRRDSDKPGIIKSGVKSAVKKTAAAERPASPQDVILQDSGREEMLAFQAGDEGAFERLVALHRLSVLRFILRTVRDEDRAEDLCQEVFFRVYRSRDRYQPTATFRTWLFTIAHRLALNEIRAVRRRRRVFVELPSSMGSTPSSFRPGGRNPSSDEAMDFFASVPDRDGCESGAPDAAIQARELEAVLASAISLLPEKQRQAIELQRTESFCYQEIAEILELSTMAVKSLLVRARETLRRAVDRYQQGIPGSEDHPPT